ncbi:hypothetical protein BRC90_06875 [Halobacteriales archaeon QS_4_69_34]|nr:MAG: hypothetical protein BRC90_06875 [Halobacteriales archaeon QS_4_69_34]
MNRPLLELVVGGCSSLTEDGATAREGVDDELDAREHLAVAEDLEAAVLGAIEAIRSGKNRSSEEFREAFISSGPVRRPSRRLTCGRRRRPRRPMRRVS